MGCKPSKHVIEDETLDVISAAQQLPKGTDFVRESQDNFHDHYKIIKQMGSGSMGAVFLVEKKELGVEKSNDELDQSASAVQRRASYVIKPRRFAMKTILINRLHEVYYHKREVCLVMELCNGGHLDIVKRKSKKENQDSITEFKEFAPVPAVVEPTANVAGATEANEPVDSPSTSVSSRTHKPKKKKKKNHHHHNHDSGDDESLNRKSRSKQRKDDVKLSVVDDDDVVDAVVDVVASDEKSGVEMTVKKSDDEVISPSSSSSSSSSDSESTDDDNNNNDDDDDKKHHHHHRTNRRHRRRKRQASVTSQASGDTTIKQHDDDGGDKHAAAGVDDDEQMSEVEVCDAIIQVLQGLAFLHVNNVAHRDLKLENIMYETDDPNSTIKLIDFGLSQVYNRGEKMRSACGTIYTMAPEVASQAGYTQQADMWSVGVIAYVLLSGQFPFLSNESDLLDKPKLDRLLNAQVSFPSAAWEPVSQESRRFIGSLFRRRPESRWTATQALEYATDVWRPAAAAISGIEGRDRQNLNPAMLRSIQHFANYEKLKRVMLMIVAFSMDKSKLLGLRDAFITLDSGKEGTISLAEFRNGLDKFGISDEEASKLYSAVDMDGTGRIHYMEFLAATLEARGFLEEERLTEAFERLDTSGSGSISANDIKALLGESSIVTEDVYDAIIAEIEKRSGKISYNEFIELMSPIVQEENNPYTAIMTGNIPQEIASKFDRTIHASRALSTPSLSKVALDRIKQNQDKDKPGAVPVVYRTGSMDVSTANHLATIAQTESDEIESQTDEAVANVSSLIASLDAERRSDDGVFEGRERRVSH